MSRLQVFVLLAAGVMLTAGTSEAGQDARAAGSQGQTTAATAPAGAPDDSQERIDTAQGRLAHRSPGEGGEDAAGQAGEAPARTDAAEGADGDPEAPVDEEGKLIAVPGGSALGMSILGNQEAPTSLVIVPWKTSELGDSLGISPMLDDSRAPVDRDVFMRALRYYEISSGTARQDGATTGGRETGTAGSDATQSTAPRRR